MLRTTVNTRAELRKQTNLYTYIFTINYAGFFNFRYIVARVKGTTLDGVLVNVTI